MDLASYLDGAAAEERDFTITVGAETVSIRLRCPDAQTLQKAHKAALTNKKDPVTKEWRRETDPKKLRAFLISDCLIGWDGMTWGLAAKLAKRVPPNGDQAAQAKELVPFEPEHVAALLERVMGLEGELWVEVLQLSHEREQREDAEKNA